MDQCIQECLHCHFVCFSMAANHCLEAGGPYVEPHHFRTMLDCAQMCQTSADFMLRSSDLHAKVCAVCADTCAACAASCEKVGDMTECVESCRRCEQSCRSMAQAA